MWGDEGHGGLGFVVWFPAGHPLAYPLRGRFFFSSRMVGLSDLHFLSRTTGIIGQLELLAAAAVYVSFPSSAFEGADVIHFIDNTSALYGLVKGHSSRPDSLSIIRAFHVINLAQQANVWFNYVATKANIGDLPSRDALEEMAAVLREFEHDFALGSARVDMTFPEMHADPAECWAAVLAQLTPVASGPRPPRGGRRTADRRGSRGKRPRGGD